MVMCFVFNSLSPNSSWHTKPLADKLEIHQTEYLPNTEKFFFSISGEKKRIWKELEIESEYVRKAQNYCIFEMEENLELI